jgi:putative ABC transport system permease protein
MLKNYFKIAFRNLIRNKIYSLINITGLSVGIAAYILITVFVLNELNYDKHNKNYKSIYRVVTDMFVGLQENNLSVSSFPTAPALKKDYPEVIEAARFVDWNDPFIKVNNHVFKEKEFFFADNSALKIFTFNFLEGDSENPLTEPNTVVITQNAAEKYFGHTNVIGKYLLYENNIELKITGVVEKLNSNSHLNFDFLVSFSTLENVIGKDYLESWHAFFKIYTYILVPENYYAAYLEKKLPAFVKTYMDDEIAKSLGRSYKIKLQPLADLHLYSDRISEPPGNGSIDNIYIFSLIAIFILLLACINFTNLSTARAVRRLKEVGLRKVLGAEKKQLIFQFITESIISTFVALPAAVFFAELLLPYFNSLSGKNLSINYLGTPEFILAGIFFITIISLIAGGYPALFLSKGGLNQVLKTGSNITSGKGSSYIRKGLIVFQFTISITLIVSTLVVIDQVNYAREKKLGINKESVIVLSFSNENIRKKYPVFRDVLLKNPSVINSTFSSYLPAKGIIRTPLKKQSGGDEEKFEMTTLPVDNNFLETFEIKLTGGRFFNNLSPSDTINSCLINEKAVKTFGWKNPEEALGKNLVWFGTGTDITLNIVGVVKDFHVQSLHSEIEPVFIIPQNIWPLNSGFISIRSSNKNLISLIPFIEEEWKQIFPSIPFEYSFLDEDFGNFYLSENKLWKIFSTFSILAIFIAALGLFGLSAFSAEVKTKEIGIRKVLGASAADIIKLISGEFILLVIISNLISWPIAYYLMNMWLMDFAFRINISFETFLLAGFLSVVISLLTVGIQAYKAAVTNPVKTLKYE